jgi:aspartate aminotransferase
MDQRIASLRVHLNPNVRGLGLSPTMAISALCARLRKMGRQVFNLGLGQSPFPVPVSVVEALRAHATRKEYLPVAGLRALREAIADYHRRRHGIAATAEDVIVGPGSKELMFLLQIVYDGEVVVPSPAWVSYAPQARIAGRGVRFVATRRQDGWRLGAEALDSLCSEGGRRARVVVLNYPSNPSGGTYDEDALRALADIARRHDAILLSDEIYGELHHEGRHVSVARFYPEGTIISSGLSKWCGAGGWRLGTFTFPRELRWLLDAMAAVASETYTSTSTPIQYAAVRAFQGGIRIERYLWNARRILSAVGEDLARRMREAEIDVDAPAGAFYLFPSLAALAGPLRDRGITTSDDVCRALLEETGVAALPGTAFGREPEELVLRLAYVDFDGTRAMAAAEQIPPVGRLGAAFLDTYCRPTLTAVDRLCEWLAPHRRTRAAGVAAARKPSP